MMDGIQAMGLGRLAVADGFGSLMGGCLVTLVTLVAQCYTTC